MDLEWLGPYQIVGKLGRGGMGTVFEGVHRETGEPAALKLLSSVLAEEEGFRTRFEAEIETLRKLNHPNIVRLFGFGEQNGQLYYSMELVDGASLEEGLRQGRRFDWREVARIGIDICRALRHAHDRGIIHRDIKPGNLLMTADGHVKLSDFGIARLFGYTRLTNPGNILGTAEYMSPEQAEGQPADARSDLYSLGALMYVLLAGRPVFRGKSLPEMLHKHRFESPEPLRRFAPDAPEEFEHIVGQLLEKDPRQRIPNATILGRRLEAMLHALAADRETALAEADWLFPEESSATAERTVSLDDKLLGPTINQPSDDLPVTEALPTSGEPPKKTDAVEARQDNQGIKTEGATRGHFTVVAEEELDQIESQPPRPAISLQTGVLAAALLAVGLIIWWFLQPPSANALHRRITAAMADNSTASLLQAQDDIDKFLNRYSDDSRRGDVAKNEKEIKLRLLERRYDRLADPRLGGIANHRNGKELLPVEQAYVEAIRYLRFDPARGIAKLRALIDLYSPPEDDAGRTAQCLTLAQRRLEELRSDRGQHSPEQIASLEDRLHAADAIRQSEPDRARDMYRAIVELYGDKPWAADVVRQARQAMSAKPAASVGK